MTLALSYKDTKVASAKTLSPSGSAVILISQTRAMRPSTLAVMGLARRLGHLLTSLGHLLIASLFIKLMVWLLVVVAVSLAALVWRPLVGEGAWIQQIAQGQLILVAVTVTASAVGYSAMAEVSGGAKSLKNIIVALGVVVLVLSLLLYGAYSFQVGTEAHTPSIPNSNSAIPHNVAFNSYILFVASLIIGAISIYLADRSEQEAVRRSTTTGAAP